MAELLALAASAFLALQGSQPATAGSRPSSELMPFDFAYSEWTSRTEGDEIVYVFREPEIRTGTLVASADRAVGFVDAEEIIRFFQSRPTGDALLRPGPELPPTGERDLLSEMRRRVELDPSAPKGPLLELRDAPFLRALRAVYLEGDVIVREGRTRSTRADALLLDFTAGRLLILNGQVDMELISGGRRIPLSVRAKLVRQEATGLAQALEAELTTCGLAVPHYHLRSGDLRIRTIGPRDIAIDATSNTLEFSEAGSIGLPDLSIYSTDLRAIPLESVRVGHSRRDGTFLRTRIGNDFRSLGEDVNRSLGIEGDFRGHWSLEVDALSRRGGAMEGTVTYETPGAYRGLTTGYYLSDRGTNVGFLSDLYEEEDANRGRVHSENRIYAGSERTWVDVEVSHSSDPLLRAEFFPNELKSQRRHENDLYFRTAGDTLSFTALAKTELDKFEPIVETGVTPGGAPPSTTNALPFFDARFHTAPIASLGVPAGIAGDAASRDLELVYRARADVGYLERHFADADLQPGLPQFVKPIDRRAGRFDTLHELSTPFSLGVAKLIPFAEIRETAATESATSSSDPSRFLGTAGAKIGSHLERDYGAFRHLVDGLVTYRNTFESTEEGSEFIPFDEVDPLDRLERVEFDLRNRLSRRDSDTGARMTFADVRLMVPLFPSPRRDNGGEPFGDVRTDVRLDLGPQFIVPDLRLRSRMRLDSSDFHARKSDTAMIVSPFGPELDLSLAYRQSGDDYTALAFAASYRIGRKWDLDVLEQFDFEENRSLQHRVLLRRYGHDFALELSFTFDTNDNDRSVAITIQPFAGIGDTRRDRFFVPEPLYRGFY